MQGAAPLVLNKHVRNATVLFLPDYKQTGADLASKTQELTSKLHDVKFVFPTGPSVCSQVLSCCSLLCVAKSRETTSCSIHVLTTAARMQSKGGPSWLDVNTASHHRHAPPLDAAARYPPLLFMCTATAPLVHTHNTLLPCACE